MGTSTLPLSDQPLGNLNVNQYSYSNFIYPLDLGVASAGKDHYMVFHINASSNTQFKTATTAGATQGPGTYTTVNGVPTFTPATSTMNQNATADINGTSTSSPNGGTASQSVVGNQTRNVQRVATTIILYMPQDISVSYGADWSQKELGVAKDITSLFKGSSQGSFEERFKNLAVSTGISGLDMTGTWANQFFNLDLKDALSLGTRMVINNHLEVIFDGIKFRQFNFTFRFTPESEQEAENVDNIIQAFKFYSAPEILQGWAGRFWIYPAEFDIQYYANGKENLFLNKISTCALTNIQVNYTPTGHWAAFRGHQNIQGAPSVCTDMALSFIELELITKKRVLEGY